MYRLFYPTFCFVLLCALSSCAARVSHFLEPALDLSAHQNFYILSNADDDRGVDWAIQDGLVS